MFRIRLICAAVIAVFMIGGMTGAFYPVKVFDVQFSAAFQRNLTAFSWGAAVGLAFPAMLTVSVWCKGRWFCTNLCPVGAVPGLVAKRARNKIVIDADKCASCGLCATKCPRQIIERADGEPPRISADECVGCGACQNACPVQAITIEPVFEQRILQK